MQNRWVPPRHVLRPVEVPIDTERVTHRHHRWLAAGFVLGGLVAVFGLFSGLDATTVGAGFSARRFAPLVTLGVGKAKRGLIAGRAPRGGGRAMVVFFSQPG